MSTLKKKEYVELLHPLQVHLCNMQRWVQATGQRVVVVFEGRDTAGKGGAISAISQVLNPRGCRVVALPKPNERERTQWYFQRYAEHLPAAGEIVLFDRSWYNRGGVERVMGFCNDAEYKRWMVQTPQFEQMLIDDGILLFKYWFSVDQAQQEERFAERIDDPLKRWKISPIDIAARTKYNDYTIARDEFFKATHRKHTPWFVVDANDQKRARLNMIAHLLEQLPDLKIAPEPLELLPLQRKTLGKDKLGAKAVLVRERY
ncbi:MAG: polyphosphate kinase 2 [Rhodanobacteraceae bacterium]|nr:polyphosphate kinase 2 [Rhodanobacteraceae bacterium]